MSNIATVVIDDVEVAATKILGWLGAAGKVVIKVATAEPQAIAALAAILSAVGKAVTDAAADAANPSVTLSSQEIADIKAVWPDIVEFVATFGIKI
jgi:hypothetical protein